MAFISRNLTLGVAAVAATLLATPGLGMSTTLGGAGAAPLAPQTMSADAGSVILAKDKGVKCCGVGGGGIPPGPGKFKDGGGGGGGKGGKGGDGGGNGWGVGAAVVGGAIVLGLGYCSAQSERCEEEYGEDTSRYWRCMRRAGCASD
jgi:hypothetical protein